MNDRGETDLGSCSPTTASLPSPSSPAAVGWASGIDTGRDGLKNQVTGRKDAAMKLLTAVFLCALAIGVPACRQTTGAPFTPPQAPSDLIVGTGTLVGRQAECSSWYLLADAGTLYELNSLDDQFRQMNLRVRFAVREFMLPSTCMRGAKVEVVSMTRL